MRTTFNRIFLDHPKVVDETYFEHFRFAMTFAVLLFGAAFAALVHAFIPCLFEKTASQLIKKMHHKIVSR